ncbi:MAG: hypothetical protein K1X53_01420, partial [Candidatus Sumerlaeaceae bacterium]|nr:hypothetical protein [Candidatus Sumerlaeaceae bacterium]
MPGRIAEGVVTPSREFAPAAHAAAPAAASDRAHNFILTAALTLYGLIVFSFTPYTHQLDEIKWSLFLTVPSLLLAAGVFVVDPLLLRKPGALPLRLLMLAAFVMGLSLLINSRYRLTETPALLFQFGGLAFTWIIACHGAAPRRSAGIAVALVAIGLGTAILGMLFYHGGLSLVYDAIKSGTPSASWRPWALLAYTLSETRVMYSTILGADFYAQFLVGLIPLALVLMAWPGGLGIRLLGGSAFLAMTHCLLMTSYIWICVLGLCLAVIALALLLFRGGRGRFDEMLPRAGLVGALVLCVCAVAYFAVLNWARSWSHGFSPPWLFGIWKVVVPVWLHGWSPNSESINWVSLLFGVGPGGFRIAYPLYRAPDFFDHGINSVTPTSFNIILDTLCEYGLVGLLAMCALL